MRTAYINSLLAAARAGGWKAADVSAMTFVQVAAACKVSTKPTPADFWYASVRAYAAKALEVEEREVAIEAKRVAIEAVLSIAGVAGTVLSDDDGNIVVSSTAGAMGEIVSG